MYARVEKLSLFIVEISEASGIGSLVYFASIDRIFIRSMRTLLTEATPNQEGCRARSRSSSSVISFPYY